MATLWTSPIKMSAWWSGAAAWMNWPAAWCRCCAPSAAGIDRYYNDKPFTMKVIAKYTKENDPDIIERTYEFYRKAGFRRELMISEPGVQGILDFLSETVPETKKATPGQFFDDRFVRQLNSAK